MKTWWRAISLPTVGAVMAHGALALLVRSSNSYVQIMLTIYAWIGLLGLLAGLAGWRAAATGRGLAFPAAAGSVTLLLSMVVVSAVAVLSGMRWADLGADASQAVYWLFAIAAGGALLGAVFAWVRILWA